MFIHRDELNVTTLRGGKTTVKSSNETASHGSSFDTMPKHINMTCF